MEKITKLKVRLENIDIKIGEIMTMAQKRIDRLEIQARKLENQIKDIEEKNEIHNQKLEK